MILWVHERLKRWAVWYLSPVGPIFPGRSGTIEQKIREGRGQILPGIPKGSGVAGVLVDPQAAEMERLIARLPKGKQKLIRVFYLGTGTVERKARSLRMTERKFYLKIHLCHKHLAEMAADR